MEISYQYFFILTITLSTDINCYIKNIYCTLNIKLDMKRVDAKLVPTFLMED